MFVSVAFLCVGMPSATVHRLECPYAQEALNKAKAMPINDAAGDSTIERRSKSKLNFKNARRPEAIEYPVQLMWPTFEDENSWEDSNSETFLTEVVVIANDRKLLLADCSVVASTNSEILKTGSSSTSEHCVLEFLVRVRDLDDLQILMNKLLEVNSVMSVERRVSYVYLVFELLPKNTCNISYSFRSVWQCFARYNVVKLQLLISCGVVKHHFVKLIILLQSYLCGYTPLYYIYHALIFKSSSEILPRQRTKRIKTVLSVMNRTNPLP
jgi:hypothetical protein